MVCREKDKSWNILFFWCVFQLDISHIYMVVWEPFPFNSILNFNSFDIIGISIASVFTL
jgi:intracellular septation protein A